MRTVDGLQVPTGGDVIVAIDGKPVSTTNEVQSAIDARRPGDEVRITVLRDGDRRTLAVTLGTRPS
jgi:S1-C subfamily serine protease